MVLFLKRFLFGMTLTGLAVTSAIAQEDPVEPSLEDDAIVSPDVAPAARVDAIEGYQVRVADTEYMAGRLQVVDPYTGEVRGVRKTGLLVVQEGKVVARAETGAAGVAQIKALPVGSYSIVAIGPDGIAAFGFEVLPKASGVAVPSYRFDTMVVPSSEISVGQQAICEGFRQAPQGPAVVVPPVPAVGPTPAPLQPIPAVEVPVAFQEPIRGGDEAYETVRKAAPLKGQPIVVREGHSGAGRLLILNPKTGQPAGMANARISFLRGGKPLISVQTDAEGRCEIPGLEDGYYSMVGVGTGGFVAMGIQVRTIDGLAAAKANDDTYVSLLQPYPAGEWAVAGASVDAIGYAPGFGCGGCGEPLCCGGCGMDPGLMPIDPYGAGGYAGYGGGGGGFGAGGGGGLFGGGGLLGALVGAGVGAGIGAALSDDDDEGEGGGGGGGEPASPASP